MDSNSTYYISKLGVETLIYK